MPRGGARNRSGPPPDPDSGRSEARGFKLTALPAEGFKGRVPRFPLPPRSVYYVIDKVRHLDEEATAAVQARELELWRWAWRTPQACAWSMPSERWRTYTVALWVRTAVICEGSDATAADKGSLHRFADQIGMTTAGLAEMGWKVAVDELAAKAADRQQPPAAAAPSSKRLRAASDGGR